MTRLESLLRLYALALATPDVERPGQLRAWLVERKGLLAPLLSTGPPNSIERALVALVIHADRATLAALQRRRHQIGQQLRGSRWLYPGTFLPGRSRGFR